jgi:HK97 family phage major capsid protein
MGPNQRAALLEEIDERVTDTVRQAAGRSYTGPLPLPSGSYEVSKVIAAMFGQTLQPKDYGSGGWYSIGRAIRNACAAEDAGPGGLEGEVSREIAHQLGRDPKGFFIPLALPMQHVPARRSLTVAGSPGAIQTTLPERTLIDVLRPKLVIRRLGGRVTNLTYSQAPGNVAVPAKTAASTVSWVGEGAAPASQSNMTVGQVEFSPFTATAYTDITRRMLKLGEPEFEEFVVDDLTTSVAVATDLVALNGSGQGQSLGLFQRTNIPSLVPAADSGGNGGKPAYTDLVAMEKLLGMANGDAPMDARVGFVTSPQGRSALRRTDLGGSTVTGRYAWKCHTELIEGMWVPVETVLGYPAAASTNVPANITQGSGSNLTAAILGDFGSVCANYFGLLDVLVNPYLQSSSGVVRVSIFFDVDVQHLRGAFSFVNLVGIDPS